MLAVCAALGRPLFGVDTVPCKVLYTNLEDSAAILRHRLAGICRAWLIDPATLQDRLFVVDGTEHPELFEAESRAGGDPTHTYRELRDLVTSGGFGLVIVDNASDAFAGDEIVRRQVRAFIRSLKEIAKLSAAALLLLSHVDKSTSRAKSAQVGESYSGSTAWHNSVRSRLFLSRGDDGLLTLEHQKSNLGMLREPLTLAWVQGGLPQVVADGFSGELTQGRLDDDKAIALIKMIAEFEGRGQYCSPVATARNNVFATLRSEPSFQLLKLNSESTKRIVNQCQRAGWIEPSEHRSPDRKTRQHWTVTPIGRDVSGLPAPSAPCAPSCQESAQGVEVAPSAPSSQGGTGGKRTPQQGAKPADVGASPPPKKRKPRAAK